MMNIDNTDIDNKNIPSKDKNPAAQAAEAKTAEAKERKENEKKFIWWGIGIFIVHYAYLYYVTSITTPVVVGIFMLIIFLYIGDKFDVKIVEVWLEKLLSAVSKNDK